METFSGATNQSFDLMVPPIDVVERIPELADYDIHLDTCSYNIHSVAHGLQQLGRLLLMMVSLSTQTRTSYRSLPIVEDYRIWVLDSVVLKTEIEHKWLFGMEIKERMPANQLLSLQVVNSILVRHGKARSRLIDRKASMILVDILVELLKDSQNPESIHPGICSTLSIVFDACKQYDTIAEASRLRLLPSLRRLIGDNSQSQVLESDFKVI